MKVMKGANCWTDHDMVRARLRMMFSLPANVKKRSLPFAVQVGTRLHKRTFRKFQRMVQKAVSNAKSEWIGF